MHTSFTILKNESFCLWCLRFFQRNLVRVNFFYLLIEEKQTNLKYHICFLQSCLTLNSKMHNIVHLHLLFIVPQKKTFGKKGRSFSVNTRIFNYLRIWLHFLQKIFMSVSKWMRVYFLHEIMPTSFDWVPAFSKQS